MGEHRTVLQRAVTAALATVIDPELDEPITDLGFVRSVTVSDDARVVVHLRLPTSFCSPNFAFLMASDAKDVVRDLPGVRSAVVELDDHHDSDLINAGLASDAGFCGTFGHEAERSLDDLRLTFRRKAHTAAMERALSSLLRADPRRHEGDLPRIRLRDLPDDATTAALLRRREALGLGNDPGDPVFVDDHGRPYATADVPRRWRMARSVRLSIDGNAHFCRGLLRTRYPGAEHDQAACAHGETERPLLPLKVIA